MPKSFFTVSSNDDPDNYDDPSNRITDKHFEAWGRIVWAYAQLENGLRLALSQILAIPLHEVFVFTEGLTSLSLRNVCKASAKLYLSEELKDEFVQIVGDFGATGRVRNHISHNKWTSGDRDGSLRPVQMDIRQGRADAKGYEPGEVDYTLEDFGKAADDLFKLNARLIQFLVSDALAAHMATKIADNKREMEEALGLAAQADSSSQDETH